MFKQIFDWLDYNRCIVVGVLVGIVLAVYAGCNVPQVASPLDDQKVVDSRGLAVELKVWQARQEIMAAKFEAAGQDMQEQILNQAKIDKLLNDFAANAGNLAAWPGLLIGGGGLGAIIDNIRKRGVISGLKRNK